jgi:FHA domain-containing protein/regulatory LuxR family protein
MAHSPIAPHTALPSELRERADAQRRGIAFLLFRDGAGRQRIVELPPAADRLTIGRRSTSNIALEWDTEVSRLHAELERIGDDWTLSDDGLSQNGSFVNGTRLVHRHRLKDGDTLRFGRTSMVYCAANRGDSLATVVPEDRLSPADLTDAQRRVLVALCRPFKAGDAFAAPATNQQIAAELYVSVGTVKTHLRALFEKLGVEALPQNQKRIRLVERAFDTGLVSHDEL